MAENLSSYAASLSRDGKKPYIEKVSLINGADAFLGTIPGAEIRNDLPPVDARDCFTDTDFWQECVPKAELFFRNCLLPEILGKWHTRPTQCTSTTNPASTPAISSSEPMHCYCRGPEESTMIACDNPDCPVEWFILNAFI